jgi:hypothetical protein
MVSNRKTEKLIKGRGTNPNSHGNNRIGKELTVTGDARLTPTQWGVAKKIGKGNASKGLRSLVDVAISVGAEDADILFAKLPHLGKAKLALQLLLDGNPKAVEYAESVLLELEDLEIENLYQEAFDEGIIEKPKGGAYIV